VLFDIPGIGQAEYDTVVAQFAGGRGLHSLSDWPEEGVLAHVAGPIENGFPVADVWESAEAFERFGARLLPLMQQAGFPPVEPQIFPVHNFVKE
jgi:hypothetical protein